jgi:hypothetical protein
MLLRQTTDVFSDNRTKTTKILQNGALLIGTAGGTYHYHWALQAYRTHRFTIVFTRAPTEPV